MPVLLIEKEIDHEHEHEAEGNGLTEAPTVTCSSHRAMANTEPSILPLEREIDLHMSPQVGASLTAMVEKKPPQLVVDLSKVTYIDSSGLAILIEAMQNVGRYGGKF